MSPLVKVEVYGQKEDDSKEVFYTKMAVQPEFITMVCPSNMHGHTNVTIGGMRVTIKGEFDEVFDVISHSLQVNS